jgi:hypothetical protein
MSRPIFFQCVVIDNQDPLMLGRVRARLKIDNYEDIIKSVENWNPLTDPWTERDPFIFNPLLPYFIYQVPLIDEIIQIIYVNRDFKYQNQYYVQNNFYSPNAVFDQYNVGGDKFTGTGMQIKSPRNIKNKDGTYPNNFEVGLYPEPGDQAILGRGSADLIVKKTDVLLRAGKYKSVPQSNINFTANNKRAFLQLSQFDRVKKNAPNKTVTKTFEVIVQVKYLIEWVITNPENNSEKFCGAVYLYQLKPDSQTNSKQLTVSSVLPENLKNLVTFESFNSKSKLETIQFINNFIRDCNDKTTTRTGKQLFSQNINKFPIYFRPSNITYEQLNPAFNLSNFQPVSSTVCPPGQVESIQKNLSEIYAGIRLNPSDEPGFGLIWKSNTVGIPTKTEIEEIEQQTYVAGPTTFGALGSDNLFLLSHLSSIPGKKVINFDGTLYGISGETFYNEIIPNTSSMVRGEELLELINLIVRFLVTHTHAYPGLPPVPVTQDGTSVSDILTELQLSLKKILNQNIRLN